MPTFDTISEWVLENLYLVGAVTAVVLLVVLIVLLAAARRRRRLAHDKGADFFELSSSLGDMDLVTPLGAEVPAASAPSGRGTLAEDTRADDEMVDLSAGVRSAVPTTTPSTGTPASPSTAATHTGSGKDHAREIVLGMIDGRGKLTAQELRRIGLMRPEQILAAVDEIEQTLKGKGKESQRARLAEVRQHAEKLLQADVAAPPRADTPEPSAAEPASPSRRDDRVETRPAAAAAAPVEAAPAAVAVSIAATSGETTGRGSGAVDAPGGGAAGPETSGDTDRRAPFQRRGSLFPRTSPVIIEAVIETEESGQTAAEPEGRGYATDPRPGRSKESSEEKALDDDARCVPESALDAVIHEPLTFEPPSTGRPLDRTEPSGGLLSDLGRAGAAEAETWSGWEAADAGETWEIEGQDESAESWFTAHVDRPRSDPGPGDSPLQAPSQSPAVAGGTAEAILAMSSDERAGALSGLRTSELGRLYGLADDKRLRISIIEALDTTPTPEAVALVQRFLDDPEPEVQLRALEAAEKMLDRLG